MLSARLVVGEYTAATSVGFQLLHVAPSVSCPCADARLTRRSKLPPSPASSRCLPMSTTRLSFLSHPHPKAGNAWLGPLIVMIILIIFSVAAYMAAVALKVCCVRCVRCVRCVHKCGYPL